MGTEQFWQAVIGVLPNLGVGIIFVYLYMQERKYGRERDKENAKERADAIKAQVKITVALDNNTRAIEAMTEKVERILEHNSNAIHD